MIRRHGSSDRRAASPATRAAGEGAGGRPVSSARGLWRTLVPGSCAGRLTTLAAPSSWCCRPASPAGGGTPVVTRQQPGGSTRNSCCACARSEAEVWGGIVNAAEAARARARRGQPRRGVADPRHVLRRPKRNSVLRRGRQVVEQAPPWPVEVMKCFSAIAYGGPGCRRAPRSSRSAPTTCRVEANQILFVSRALSRREPSRRREAPRHRCRRTRSRPRRSASRPSPRRSTGEPSRASCRPSRGGRGGGVATSSSRRRCRSPAGRRRSSGGRRRSCTTPSTAPAHGRGRPAHGSAARRRRSRAADLHRAGAGLSCRAR